MTSDEIQFKTRIPEDLKRLVDQDSRSNKQVVKELLENEFRSNTSKLESEIEDIKDELNHLEKKRERVLDRIEDKREELERKREILDEIENEQEDYEEFLDKILDKLAASDRHLIPGVVKNEDGYDDQRESPQQIIDDAKERAIEQGRDRILEEQFMEGTKSSTRHQRPVTELADETTDDDRGSGETSNNETSVDVDLPDDSFELDDRLDVILDALEMAERGDETFFPAVEDEVETLTADHDATKAELVDRLKRRAAEQERTIYDVQFLSMNEAKQKVEQGHDEQLASEAFDVEDDEDSTPNETSDDQQNSDSELAAAE